MMHRQKQIILVIIFAGGSAVLSSYALGFIQYADASQALWGGIPQNVRPLYTLGMLLGALGYFAYTYFILFRLRPENTRISNRNGYELFNILYFAILFPSALWLPFTIQAVEQSSQLWEWIVKTVLMVVAGASLGLLAALLKVEPRQPPWSHKVAVLGCFLFCFQTVVLDALVWGALFHV